MEQMQHHGAIVEYSDPYVPVFPKMRRYSFDLNSVELTADAIAVYDCIIIGTNHDDFDFGMIKQHAKLVVDTRGVYRGESENIVHA
jgi:UDP-N-acetyl-D-glucosamine dehydrogenase